MEGLITLHLATELYEGVKRTQAISPNVVEVGAFKGLSTIFMSLGSYEVNKRVKSFEMFTGLPVCNPKLDSYWKIGEFASEQEEYELNVTRYGRREVVDLVVGDARETILPTLGVDGFSFAFLDVDVYEVMRDLLFKLWSIARGGEIIFVHDIHSPGIRQAVDELKQVAGRKVVEARPENVTARIHVVNR
ncbi:MAG: class I SAM-dependent methyltransferase [Deltaproteobacteria bacterium]|nr:class I SAM-dependent methyltransferase [Deltaproteobacteria bacterium]